MSIARLSNTKNGASLISCTRRSKLSGDEVYTAYPSMASARLPPRYGWMGCWSITKLWRAICRTWGYEQSTLSHAVYPCFLRGLTVKQRNQVWGVDITYSRLPTGWLYLFAVLDWYSRFVVSWTLDPTPEIGFVLAGMRQALARATPVICNSDQCSHFTSPQYLDLLRPAQVQISMDGKGRALDNLLTERLWPSVKYEEVYLKEYASPPESQQSISRYLDFYNQQRLHQALAYQTPASIYFKKGDLSTDNLPIFCVFTLGYIILIHCRKCNYQKEAFTYRITVISQPISSAATQPITIEKPKSRCKRAVRPCT